MKNLIYIFFLLSIVYCGGCQMFSEVEERPADISLTELQKRMHKAMDPEGLYRKSKTYVQKQMLVIKKDWEDEKSFIIEVKYKRPNKMKMTTLEDNRPTTSLIFNGQNAWVVQYGAKTRRKVKGKNLERMKVLFALGKPGMTFEQIFKNVKISETDIDDLPYYKLTCISKYQNEPTIIIYVGKNNFLTKRIEIPPRVVSTIDKYGLYDGVITPEETTEELGDSKKHYRLITYKLNVDIPDSEFFPPMFKEK